MQLSIVECSDYRNSKNWEFQIIPVEHTEEGVESVGPVMGPSAAVMRNRGAQVARGDWIFFKDSDCDVEVSQLLSVINKLNEQDQKPIVGGIYRNRNKGYFSKVYQSIQRKWVLSGLDTKNKKASHLLGGALLVPRNIFLAVGPFNEKIGWGAEETDWTQRAIKMGFKTSQSYRIQVQHDNKLTLLGFFKRAWFQNFNSAYYEIEKVKLKGIKRYIFSSIEEWPGALLFFSVATIGRGAGRAMKKSGF